MISSPPLIFQLQQMTFCCALAEFEAVQARAWKPEIAQVRGYERSLKEDGEEQLMLEWKIGEARLVLEQQA